MANDRVYVDLEALVHAERAFEQALNALREELDLLDSRLSAHLAEWTGDAKKTYVDAHAKWRDSADDMARSLDFLKGVIGVAHRNFRRSKAANLQMWNVT